ncbi:MAG: hypothetical protein QFX33_00625 [Candidatus Nezhaarchaeota archaeon]|nr:hypothetical protein [Candidatus Nezhaarchaeota archaeon]
MSLRLLRTSPGKGVAALLTGGDEPHVGAVAVSIPSSVVHHPEKVRGSTSVFTVPGHMDDQVAAPLAKRMAEALGEPVVVVCGLHVHAATAKDIRRLVENSHAAVEKALKRLSALPAEGRPS